MYGKCIRCNRQLKDATSVERGYGPVCWAKVQADRESEKVNQEMNDQHIDEPTDECFIMQRNEQGIATNCPHLVVDHSPTGFEFGYAGSGPADLALNILETVLRQMGYKGERTKDTWRGDPCFKLAYALHQSFKFEFIAGMPREGGKIYTNDIIQWVNTHEPMFAD